MNGQFDPKNLADAILDSDPILEENPASQLTVQETAQRGADDDLRLRRVLDYQAAALAKDNPLLASVACLNAGLMRLAFSLESSLERAMERGTLNVESLKSISPAIDTQLRVLRQVDRFTQLELKETEQSKAKGKLNQEPGPSLVAPHEDHEQSEDSEI